MSANRTEYMRIRDNPEVCGPVVDQGAGFISIEIKSTEIITRTPDAFEPAPPPAPAAEPATAETDDGWEWMLVEVLGHRRHSGRVREEERFGAKLLRIDVPVKGDPTAHGWQTHYYAPASLYGLTPCTREAAFAANKPYERPSRLALPVPRDEFGDDMPF
ncbi:hypothetical protein [Methylobacterium organophilum]|uniref:Uncharacterized protein n=1 Tax=Methylobacterium organophilum TaxID=410 RepID=A0ABQ4TEZ3_METOR|nr:hypothetical protein [Methylobacterium organophilum]GJE29783.1 hypothetical protein LKMONMHP_4669 [Methylobacterium organophilum]